MPKQDFFPLPQIFNRRSNRKAAPPSPAAPAVFLSCSSCRGVHLIRRPRAVTSRPRREGPLSSPCVLSIVLRAFVLLLLLVVGDAAKGAGSYPVAERGVLDLSAWDFARGSVPLSGTWEMYWGQLIPPEAFAAPDALPESIHVPVPGPWGQAMNGDAHLSDVGFATFRLRVELGAAREPLALVLRSIRSAYALWVNGDLVLTRGQVATTPEEERALGGIAFVDLGRGLTHLDIVLHVSNHSFRSGGIQADVVLGREAELSRALDQRLAADVFLTASLLVIGLYTLGIWSINPQSRHALFLGLFCLLLGARTSVMNTVPAALLLPALSWDAMLKIEYLGFYLGVPLMALFLWSLYPKEFSDRAVAGILAVSMGFSIFVLVTPPRINSQAVVYYEIFAASCFVYLASGIVRAVRYGRDGARLILAGAAGAFLAVIHDFLYYWNVLGGRDWAPVAFIAMSLLYSLTISKRLSDEYERQRFLMRQNAALLETVRRQMLQIKDSRRLLHEGEERTRRSIAEMLHGTVQSRLLSARMYLQSTLRSLAELAPAAEMAGGVDRVRSMIERAHEQIDRSREDVREISHMLHPTLLSLGLEAALATLAERFSPHFTVDLRLGQRLASREREPGHQAIDPKVGLAVYRIVEEALANALKHAQASKVEVVVDLNDDGALEVTVKDDGRGMDQAAVRRGVGLEMIAARVEELHGTVDIASAPGAGTCLYVWIPKARKEDGR